MTLETPRLLFPTDKSGNDHGSTVTANMKPKGPPNRMNDLDYSTWMKFQKSFFWFESTHALLQEWIAFFTKSVWPNGVPSRSLLLGDIPKIDFTPPRVVQIDQCTDLDELLARLLKYEKTGELYDFALIDLRGMLNTAEKLDQFLRDSSHRFFGTLRRVLVPGRYLTVLVDFSCDQYIGYPIPWALSDAGRDYLRLRDEKIALSRSDSSIFYCIHFQAVEDERSGRMIYSNSIRLCPDCNLHIPAWLLPSPPPRKPNEILHPAKFPETLIEEFITLFTEQGETVFDPMVGTGSAVLAAVRLQRNGVGVELSPRFAEIARERLAWEQQPIKNQLSLFPDNDPQLSAFRLGNWSIIEGDAANLLNLTELRDLCADYVVTSPPYWSMLRNKGSENQRKRRDKNLPLVYSENDDRDLGNIEDYDEFVERLAYIYNHCVASKLKPGGYLTVIVKNVKREHVVYPLAWDIVLKLAGRNGSFEYVGNTFWCQDNIGMKPFAVGTHWVSNVVHQYCLHFRRF